jgi:hypothetical protein
MKVIQNQSMFLPNDYYNQTKQEATPKLIIKEKPRSLASKQNALSSNDPETAILLNQHIENIKASIDETNTSNFKAKSFSKEFKPFGGYILNEAYLKAFHKPIENIGIQMNESDQLNRVVIQSNRENLNALKDDFYQGKNRLNCDDELNAAEIGYTAVGLETNRLLSSNRKLTENEQNINNKFNHFTLSNVNQTSQYNHGHFDYNRQVCVQNESYMRDLEFSKVNQSINNASLNEAKTSTKSQKSRQTIMTSLKNLIIPNSSSRAKSVGVETRK